MPQDQRPPATGHLEILRRGEIRLLGQLAWSSNATFLVRVGSDDSYLEAIYKPRRGERPLWDFGPGLDRREVAAYLLSEELGWGLVPETVLRDDAPLGTGSLQRFVPADFSRHYFHLREDPSHRASLVRLAAFDVVANNADRKAGHCLVAPDGRIWGIDNGLCFHEEPKLRTVIWDFGGEALGGEERRALEAVAESGAEALAELLSVAEMDALRRRAAGLVSAGRLPAASEDERRYPWPLV